MTINELAEDIIKQENNRLSQSFTMVIGSVLVSKGIQPVIEKSCEEWNENDDVNKYIIRKEYNVTFDIDTTEHDRQIYNKALEDFGKKMKEANSIALYYRDIVDLEEFMQAASDEIKKELMK